MNSPAAQPELNDSARRWKWAERSFTLAAMVVAVWLACSAMRGMTNLFSSDSTQNILASGGTEKNESQHPYAMISPNLLAEGGYWRMSNWQWEVGIIEVADVDIDRRLTVDKKSAIAPTQLADHENAAMTRIVRAIQHLPIERIENGDLNEYRVDNTRQKVRVFTRGDGDQERLISISAAIRDRSSGTWKLLELRSKPTRVTSHSNHLLPLRAGTETVCARTESGGRLLLEVVQTSSSLKSLIPDWESVGWKLKPMMPGRLAAESYLCTNGNRAVHVWEVTTDDPQIHRLALVRLSDHAGGKPAE